MTKMSKMSMMSKMSKMSKMSMISKISKMPKMTKQLNVSQSVSLQLVRLRDVELALQLKTRTSCRAEFKEVDLEIQGIPNQSLPTQKQGHGQ